MSFGPTKLLNSMAQINAHKVVSDVNQPIKWCFIIRLKAPLLRTQLLRLYRLLSPALVLLGLTRIVTRRARLTSPRDELRVHSALSLVPADSSGALDGSAP